MTKTAYYLDDPATLTSGVVFASPHSGRDYPWAFLRHTVLDEHVIRSSEDAYVDRLFDCAPRYGAPLLRAAAPRAFVDLNRSPDELDPALIENVRRNTHNPRVASGLGVVPRVVANGRAIYRGKLPLSEAQERLSSVWHPYHARLQSLLTRASNRFGEAVLIDCHSMPHEAVESASQSGARPEIVIGDRFGASARGDIVDRVEAAFVAAGFRVVRNAPFAGAFITQNYGRPSRKQHAIQIEIDRALYMDERKILPHSGFHDVQQRLSQVVADLVGLVRPEAALAAE